MTTGQKELPAGWKWVKLGDVVSVVGGGTPSRTNPSYWDGEFPWATVTDMNQARMSGTLETITALGFEESSSHLVPKGTVIVATRVGLGKVSLPSMDVCINQDLKALIPISASTINTEYLFYVMISNAPLIESMGTGATVKGIRLGQLTNIPIPLPPIVEQKRIAGILNKAEAIKKLREEADKKTEELIPAIFHEMVGSRIEKGEALPIGWKWVKLGGVSKITARLVDPTADEYADLPHVNGENITSGSGQLYGIKTVSELGMISGKYLFNPGDVLYSKIRPYLKKAATVNFTGLCSADMYPIVANPNQLDSYWLWALLLSDGFTHYANKESARSRMPKLNRTQLMSWEFPLPPIDEQKLTAERLSAVTEIKKTNSESNKKIEELKSSLLHMAFKGEL